MANSKLDSFIQRNFGYFKAIYKNKKEMSQYYEKFQNIYSESENAESDFLALHEFYQATTSMKNQTVRLVMIISLIEKLSSEGEFLDFPEWLKKTERNIDKDCNVLWSEYNQKFGCSGKFRRFFGNAEYLNKDEQIALLMSVSTFRKKDDSYSVEHPFCHEETCPKVPFEEVTCPFREEEKQVLYGCDYERCPLSRDDKKLREGISEFADYLYQVRNSFVHGAILSHLPSGKKTLFSCDDNVITMRRYKFRRSGRRARILKISFALGAKQLEDILTRNFKKLLDAYIEKRLVSQKA